jgi:hypothetical protein
MSASSSIRDRNAQGLNQETRHRSDSQSWTPVRGMGLANCRGQAFRLRTHQCGTHMIVRSSRWQLATGRRALPLRPAPLTHCSTLLIVPEPDGVALGSCQAHFALGRADERDSNGQPTA